MTRHFGGLVTILLGLGPVLGGLSACSETPPDYSAKAAQEILEADREFAWLAERSSVSHAFDTWLADDAVILPSGSDALRGEALAAAVEAMDYNLEWAPEEAWAAKSGEFGVTWGYWTLRAIDADGNPFVQHGKYTTAWRKNDAGEWKALLDMGNEGPDPESRQ